MQKMAAASMLVVLGELLFLVEPPLAPAAALPPMRYPTSMVT